MLTYQLFDSGGANADFAAAGLSYKEIEKHVNSLMKTHRSSFDKRMDIFLIFGESHLADKTMNTRVTCRR